MQWNDLSMAERAKYIQLGVQNGVTSLSDIRNTYNSYAEGGDLEESTDRLITTGNEWGDIGLSFVPFVGSAMDWEEAIRDPSIGNYTWAIGSTVLDFLGGSVLKGAAKTYKAYKAFKAASKLDDAANAARRGAERAYRAGEMKKASRLTTDAVNLENRSKVLRNDTRLWTDMEEAPNFYDPMKAVFLMEGVDAGYNTMQLGIDALYDKAYPNGIK